MGVNRRKNSTIAFAPPGVREEFGDRPFGDPVEIRAWHQRGRRTVRDPSGQEVIVVDRLVVDVEIPYGSAVWLDKDDRNKPAPYRAQTALIGDTFRGQRVFETWL